MKIKSFFAKPYAAIISKKIAKARKTAVNDQKEIFQHLIKVGKNTVFGKEHHFEQITDYHSFKQHIPIRDYEGLKSYIDLIKEGKQNILWKGKPMYFAKTSGTTSGVKYIPITKEGIPNLVNSAKNALMCYMHESGNAEFADGKMIFLTGSPELERIAGIPTGRLSGISNHLVPSYLKGNQLPDYTTNCIEDWEEKLGKIVAQTLNKDMTLISGIPPWIQMYFDWLSEKADGKKITDIFPNLSVIVHGGVNFEPYKKKLFESLGKPLPTIETYPASEGFFAFQDTMTEEGLLLVTNSGIFYEFIPTDTYFDENPTRLSLEEIEVGVNYALIINSVNGLWGYSIGDTVKFVSKDPYRIVVTGRIKHYISAFGEHVIGEEVEQAMKMVCDDFNVKITEFTVAPYIQTEGELPYHEWLIEFETVPPNMDAFRLALDNAVRTKNIYYDDLITGNILQPLKISSLRKGSFIDYMKSIGKLGGQNKTPRLTNDRELASAILQLQ
jgi:hypothetical protein